MSRRGLTLSVVVILTAVVSCTPQDTGAGDPTTTVAAPPVECSEREIVIPEDADGRPADELVGLSQFTHAYMTRYLILPADQAEETQAILNQQGVPVAPADLSAVLPVPEGEDADEFMAARDALSGLLVLLALTFEPEDDRDALDMALAVRDANSELDASPVHAIGEAAHVGWGPGNQATPIPNASVPGAADATELTYAAVVDSGIHPDAPGLAGNVDFRVTDLEPAGGDGHSHGTFVSSLIRRLAPTGCISFARARSIDMSELTWVDHDGARHQITGSPPQALTTELHVAEAIERLILRHEHQPDAVLSLNLSVGGYSALIEGDPALVSIAEALDVWFATFPHAPVFAAGGNDAVLDTDLKFWPGALSQSLDQCDSGGPCVRAVGALNDPEEGDPEEIVWDEGTEMVWDDYQVGSRDWITDLAPGSLLVDYTSPDAVAAWSGSSFATAVANGLYLRGEDPIPPRRANVSDLVYSDGTQVLP